MRLIRFLFRAALLLAGAVLALGFFLFAAVAFAAIVLLSLLTGRKPDVQFRMSRTPWARWRPPQAPPEVVDIEARDVTQPSEVKAPAPLPLEPPRH